MSTTTIGPDIGGQHNHDRDYADLLAGVRRTFAARTEGAKALFCTATDGLFEVYLDALPAERQVHTCSTCRTFFQRFGGLVVVAEDGGEKSALWDEAAVPEFYREAAARLQATVEYRPITTALYDGDRVLGTTQTGQWTHFSVDAPPALRHRSRTLTPGQAMAEVRERRSTLARALGEFKPEHLQQALQMLEADSLDRPERFTDPLRWLIGRQEEQRAKTTTRRQRDALLWLAAATAPPGYCQPRSGMIGTLLEDLAAGIAFDDVQRRWAAKMHPLRYQRPQAAPSAGNIARAEALVAQLGIGLALERRQARLDEVLPHAVWTPAPPAEAKLSGVFAHLAPKGAEPARAGGDAIKGRTYTWEKFADEALPAAAKIELRAPLEYGSFTAFVTAVHSEAPPILRWDRDEARNPVNQYFWHGGARAAQFGLAAGQWVEVLGVVPRANLWGATPAAHLGLGCVLLLAGAKDSRLDSLALFPEVLKDELREIRSTIEAHSHSGRRQATEGPNAAGYGLGPGKENPIQLRVTPRDGAPVLHTIDRWD
jgi:hypothetical protein